MSALVHNLCKTIRIIQLLLKASFYISIISFHHICSACCPISWVGLELYMWVLIVRVRHAAGGRQVIERQDNYKYYILYLYSVWAHACMHIKRECVHVYVGG